MEGLRGASHVLQVSLSSSHVLQVLTMTVHVELWDSSPQVSFSRDSTQEVPDAGVKVPLQRPNASSNQTRQLTDCATSTLFWKVLQQTLHNVTELGRRFVFFTSLSCLMSWHQSVWHHQPIRRHQGRINARAYWGITARGTLHIQIFFSDLFIKIIILVSELWCAASGAVDHVKIKCWLAPGAKSGGDVWMRHGNHHVGL